MDWLSAVGNRWRLRGYPHSSSFKINIIISNTNTDHFKIPMLESRLMRVPHNKMTLCRLSAWWEVGLIPLILWAVWWKSTSLIKTSLINHRHHHVVPLAQISLTLSRYFSLSFINSGRSSELHPISSHSCCMYVRAGRPAFARPYVGVHRTTSLMSSSLLLQQCPACLVRLTWIVFVMGSRWPYSWCLVGCCHQDLFNIARSILV